MAASGGLRLSRAERERQRLASTSRCAAASLAPIACLNVIGRPLVGDRRGPRRTSRTEARSGCGERERPVDQVGRGVRRRVAHGQRRVTGGRDDVRGRRRRVLLRHARRERAEARRRARASARASPARCRRRCPRPTSRCRFGAAAHRIARPSCGCRPLACRRVTTLVPIRTTPLPPALWPRTTLALPAAAGLAVGAGRVRTPPARQERVGGEATARRPRWGRGSCTRWAGRSTPYGCAPLTTGPPWLTTLATPLTRLPPAVPVAVSRPALVVNAEPAVPRPTTPPPRARNASSAARLAALSVAGFSVPPTTQHVDVGRQGRGQRRRGDGLGLEAERGERVTHLGAAGVGDDDLVGDRRRRSTTPGAALNVRPRVWSPRVAASGASAAPGSAPSRRPGA